MINGNLSGREDANILAIMPFVGFGFPSGFGYGI